jgi:basic membrane protein A and related proteins
MFPLASASLFLLISGSLNPRKKQMTLLLNRRSLLTGAAASTLPFAVNAQAPLQVGIVYLTTAGDHGWTYAHHRAVEAAKAKFGDKVKFNIVESVPEGPDAERVVRQLAQAGNQIIFTTSFGYMNPTLKVAESFPNVKFEHVSGYKQAANMASFNLRYYEGRAVAGTIAGHMSKKAQAGYIASFPIPEVVMGINAFTLAARKVNPAFKTKVIWVSTWYDPAKEADAAKALLDQGADILSQHTDSPAALQIAEQRGAFAFGQGSNMSAFAPKAHLTAIENNWAPLYIAKIESLLNNSWKTGDSWTGFKEGHLGMTPFNAALSDVARNAANDMIAKLKAGTLHPFTGLIKDNAGNTVLKEGEVISDKDLSGQKYYVEGVQA